MSRFNLYAYACDLSRIAGKSLATGVGPFATPGDFTLDEARAVRRRIARHNRLAETACNRELTPREQAEDRNIEAHLAAFFGPALDTFNGDPRGQTVKLKARPDERFTYFEHDWGGNLIYTGP